jgi:radical SAM protein with 4Fe4S-binding SPASM domain
LFDRVLCTIKVARAAGLRVHVCCTITALNADKLASFVGFVSTLDVQRINLSRYVPTGRSTLGLDLPDERWPAVIRECAELKRRWKHRIEVVTHLAQQVLVDDELTDMPAYIGCQAGRGQGCVTADGAVLPCVLLPLRVGNIREAPFEEIWRTSPIIRSLQDRSNLQGRCGSCSLRPRCGGCRAVALAKTGNYLAEDPRCWIAGGPSPCLVQ